MRAPLIRCSALCLLLMGGVCTAGADSNSLQVKYVGNNFHISEKYYLDLIDAALASTRPSHGPYEIIYSEEPLTSTRKHELLVAGDKVNIDRLVGFSAVEGPRKGLLRVEQPILNGVMGYRVLLIRKEQQDLFAPIKTAAQLQRFTMGFGRGWEGYVYTHNNFRVVEAPNMDQLLKMLAGKRYSFVPLGVIEIEDNYTLAGEPVNSLAIEQNLLLYMPLPVYFYVSPAAPALAERLTLGLKTIYANGRAQQIFRQHFGARLQRLNLSRRHIIHLQNPDDDGSLGAVDHSWLKALEASP